MTKKEKIVAIKYLRLLDELSAKEREHFKAFLQYRCIAKNTKFYNQILMLYGILTRYLPSINKISDQEKVQYGVSEELINADIQNANPSMVITSLDKKVNFLMNIMKEFIESLQRLNSEWEKEFQYLQFLNKRRLHKEFEGQYAKCNQFLDKLPQEYDFFYKKYLLANEYCIAVTSKSARVVDTGLIESLYWLEISYHAKKLKLIVSMMNQGRIVNTPFDFELHTAFIESCRKYQNIPFIRIYFLGYQLIGQQDEVAYDEYLKAFASLKDYFSEGEARDMFMLALNYRNQTFQRNRTSVELKRLFEVYLEGLTKGILLDGMNAHKRYISSPNLKNIIRLGLMLDKISWAKQYADEVEPLVLEEERAVILPFVKGLIAFEEGDYTQSIDLVETAYQNTQDPFFRMDLRIILLKSWYKKSKATDDLISIVDAYQDALRKYVFRNDIISPLHQERFKNFIRYFVRIWRPNYTNASDVQKVIEDMKLEDIMAEKEWLLAEAHLKYESLL